MTDHLRRLTVYVEEAERGVFHWVLIESPEDPSAWVERSYSVSGEQTWFDAWSAGAAALMRHVQDPRHGPRAQGESEDASPVG